VMKVDFEKCTGCGDCLDVCSNEAISLVAGMAVIDLYTCLACGACIQACPVGAISQVELPVPVEAVPVHPVVVQEAALLELSSRRRLVPWAGAVLTFMGREIVPRIADALIAALERRLSQPASLPATISLPLAPQGRTSTGWPRRRRRRAGWRHLSKN
jgi:NAD-dependent dihydropyrimidine dehydrogenase PreA subunit